MKKDSPTLQVTPPWGPIGYIVYKRTYARRLNENQADSPTEEFADTIHRVIESCNSQLGCGFNEQEQEELAELFMNFKGSVAGRFLWQLGTKTVDNLGLPSLQNCAVVVVNQPVRPFTWAMEMLMLGVGVGYNIQKEHVYQLPKLTEGTKEITRLDSPSAEFIVPDSREGWVKLLGKVLKSHFYTGQGFTYSTQLVRSKGAPIKGFGGTASGPEVLCKGIDDINKVLNKRSGKKLRPIDCLDVMNIIGSIVVAGNVRRSAQLALGDWDDLEFLKAKRWDLGQVPNWRAMSNNSIVPPENFKDIPIEFWETYNQGEPLGLINLELSRKCGRLGDTQYTDPNVICYNPCAEQSLENFETCVTGDTRIQTRIGVFKIKDVVGQQVEVFNGDSWSKVTPFVAKEKDTFIKITFSDGSFLKATPYHEFSVSTPTNKKVFKKLRTDELSVGMYLPKFELPEVLGVSTDFAYTLGAFAGDGYLDAGKPTICAPETVQELLFSHCHIQSPNAMWKSDERKVTMYRAKVQPNNIPQEVWTNLRNHEEGLSDYIMSLDKQSALEFLAGWIDTDGSIRNKGSEGESYAIFGCEQKIRDAQLLARRAGINFASVWKMNSKGEVTNYGTRNRDIYVLSIPTFEALSIPTKLKTITKVGDRYKVNQAHPEGSKIDTAPRQRIVAIEVLEEEEPSYCFSEPINHMGVFGNVLTYQCCLSEIYLPKINTKKELYKVAGYLYKICKHSLAIPCGIKETGDIVHKNMRMGIGVTGLLQATDEQRSWLSDCYNYLRKLDKEYSAAKGWPESIKLTTSKPSGTLSLLPDVTPGIHPAPAGPYYIRRMRISAESPLLNVCVKNGYFVEYARGFNGDIDPTTMVVEFPCMVPEGTPIGDQLGAIEHLEWIKWLQTNWSDNSVSCTVYYKKEELPTIKEWLEKNFTDSLKTVSFLLYSGHGFDQAPYETISKERYEELIAKVKPITSITVDESDFDLQDCDNGACPIK